jgi:hypothetical protein
MDKIRDRIRKLLRLARDRGANENEAAVALAAANRLMLEHNIESVGDEDENVRVVRGSRMYVDRDERWEKFVSAATATLYNCRSMSWSDGSYAFVGREENVSACEETFVWICEQVDELYKEGLKAFKGKIGSLDKSMRADFRRSFKEACASRIYHRVGDIVAANRGNIPAHKALVVIDQSLAAADEMMQAEGIRKGRTVSRIRSGFGSGAGHAAGDAVKLQEGVAKRSNSAALITGDQS